MKKLLYILFLICLAQPLLAQKNCCPDFRLVSDMGPCKEKIDHPNGGSGQNPEKPDSLLACRGAKQTYMIFPNMPGYTYTWTVIGGAAAAASGNPMLVTWGNGTSGSIQVVISSSDGLCKDTIKTLISLKDSPKAGFTFTPASPLCFNQNISFTNTSIGGVAYYWDFGDGNTSTQTNPNHTYTTPGTYTITMVAYNKPVSVKPAQEQERECGCRDTVRQTITVKPESGLIIEPGCKQMLCKGDTATYCTPNNCSSMNWSVTGGTIIGSNKGQCIKVVWDGSFPATVSLNGNCGGACGNSTTINVPVLYATMTPSGSIKVCPNTMTSYSLPEMPGTFYNWTVTGPNNIIGANQNTAAIDILWGNPPGTYTIECDYKNPHTGCSGKASLKVDVVPPFKINGLVKFCKGNSFNFYANGNASWTISPATGFSPSSFSNGSSISGTWNSPGTYTVTATTTNPSNYCITTASMQVEVLDNPVLSPIAGPILICPGSTVMYAASSNMSGGFFNWNITGGGITSYMGSQYDSVMVTWNNTGPYKVEVSQNVNGCTSLPVSVNVNTYTAPQFTGSLNTCMDNTVTYTSTTPAPPGGYNWTLSNGLGTILNGQGTNSVDILWHGSTGGNTCVLTLTTCGGSISQTVTISSPPPLTITKAGSLCSTTGLTLISSISGGTSYNWYLNNVLLGPPQNTQSINITQAGVYNLEVLINGCKAKASIVVPEEKLNITAALSTLDKTVWGCKEVVNTTLHAIPSTGYCYQWYKTLVANGVGSAIGGATTPNYTVTSPGYYYCTISICNTSCKEYTDTIRIVKLSCDTCTGIDNYTVNFTNTLCNPISFTASTSPASALGNVHWYFGDGKEGDGINITHQYKDTGTYKVCAVFGKEGYCAKEICKEVKVTIAANFTASAVCDKASFVNLSKSINPILSYNWSFPGGTPLSSTSATPPVVTYSSGGLHTVTLTITDGTCTVSYQDTVRTYNVDAVMNVPTPLCVKTDAPFTATSTSTGLTYHWDFGDGFTSNLQNVTHAYQNAGSFTVTLTVSNVYGCTKVYTQTVTVNPAPSVSIGADQKICVGDSVILTASPSSFGSYQWFMNGSAIAGATNATYTANTHGEYWVVVSNGPGCVATSNHVQVTYHTMPIAKIMGNKLVCSGNIPFSLYNGAYNTNYQYQWSITGPAAGNFSPSTGYSTTVNIPSKTPGNYEVTLIVTDNLTGCKAYDTLCVTIAQTPTLTVTAPTGTLCEGNVFTFIATASPSVSPQDYVYSWSNGFIGSTMTTGKPGMIMVTAISPMGCSVSQFVGTIKPRPDVSLFPVGCDTLCTTDTLWFPLPKPNPYGYTVNWFDDDGTAITNVGTGENLPLSGLHPGIHHFFATVSFPGGCADTTGKFNVYVKDCSLTPPCDNCTNLLDSAKVAPVSISGSKASATIVNYNLTFTIQKPVKEVRISLADLKYSWTDPNCKNCKVQILERGCLFPNAGNTSLGSLVWNDYTSSGSTLSANGSCPEELVWNNGSPLMPGTYTIPIQLSLPKPLKKDCVLKLDKICFHLTLMDTLCKTCDKIICASGNIPDAADCKCNLSDTWTNLYLVPQQAGIPKPSKPILCNTVLSGIVANTNYVLSGVYYCDGKCISSKNEIVVYNQQNQIIYTKVVTTLNEVISFPAPGAYTITLTANCGTKKCACTFKVNVGDGGTNPPGGGVNPPGGGVYPPGGNPPEPPIYVPIPPELPGKIDSVVNATVPKDFNGGIVVAKNDSVLFEKYYSYKDKVNSHTAFDIASITKTFTSAAILKLMEEGRLNLDDAVVKYLPKFPYPDITVKMLLSHRSGLEDYLQFIDEAGWDKSINVTNKDLLDVMADNKAKILIHKPGTVYDYSNTNYALLALIIEKVSGSSYADYMVNTFFKPLKMDDSYVLNLNNFAKATKSYYRNGSTYRLRYLDLIYGDKCVYSTPQDLRKWDNALRTGKVLKKSTLDIAYKTIGSSMSFSSTYTMGWKKVTTGNGKTVLYHDGWWAGNRALLIRLPDENVVIAVLSNNNYTRIKDIKKLCDLFGDYQLSTKKVTNF